MKNKCIWRSEEYLKKEMKIVCGSSGKIERIQTNKQSKKVNISLWSLPTELELFHQDVFLFIPFLGTCSIQAGKAKPDWQIPFIHALSEQAWLVMIFSQGLSAAPKLQIWWGVGWGFLAPWSGWPLLAPQSLFPIDTCLGEVRNIEGK